MSGRRVGKNAIDCGLTLCQPFCWQNLKGPTHLGIRVHEWSWECILYQNNKWMSLDEITIVNDYYNGAHQKLHSWWRSIAWRWSSIVCKKETSHQLQCSGSSCRWRASKFRVRHPASENILQWTSSGCTSFATHWKQSCGFAEFWRCSAVSQNHLSRGERVVSVLLLGLSLMLDESLQPVSGSVDDVDFNLICLGRPWSGPPSRMSQYCVTASTASSFCFHSSSTELEAGYERSLWRRTNWRGCISSCKDESSSLLSSFTTTPDSCASISRNACSSSKFSLICCHKALNSRCCVFFNSFSC